MNFEKKTDAIIDLFGLLRKVNFTPSGAVKVQVQLLGKC